MSQPSNTKRSSETRNTTAKGFQTGWVISGEICFAAILLFFANQPFDFSDTTPAPAPALVVVEIPPVEAAIQPTAQNDFGVEIPAESELKTAISMHVKPVKQP